MDSEWIIGALAFVTIGGVGILAVVHFTAEMRDKKSKNAAKNALVDVG